jgi:hypothetical protein
MPDREKKQQQGDFMSRQEMNYAKKVTKKISDCATKFEQSKKTKVSLRMKELAAKWAAEAPS